MHLILKNNILTVKKKLKRKRLEKYLKYERNAKSQKLTKTNNSQAAKRSDFVGYEEMW